MSNTSVVQVGGAIGAISVSSLGAEISRNDIEELTVLNVMRDVSRADQSCKFILGDLINYARERFGEKISEWEYCTGISYSRLKTISRTCNEIPMSIRRRGLSFSHHEVVAERVRGSEEQKKLWLELAEERNMSTRELIVSIKLGRVATEEDLALPPADGFRGIENVHPYVNRLFSFLSKSEQEGMYDSLDSEGLYEFHHDLMPITQHVAGLWKRIEQSGDENLIEQLRNDLMQEGIELLALEAKEA